jgi:hypothetical protein
MTVDRLAQTQVPHLDDTKKPAVEVYAHDSVADFQLEEILLGIEEQSIPYVVTHRPDLSPLDLAHAAATTSRLGVGIGVSLDYVVVTTEKLPLTEPYIAAQLNYNHDTDRALGASAARIVQRLPLTGPNGELPIFMSGGSTLSPGVTSSAATA